MLHRAFCHLCSMQEWGPTADIIRRLELPITPQFLEDEGLDAAAEIKQAQHPPRGSQP